MEWIDIAHICPECANEEEIAHPREVECQCLECNKKLCAAHMIWHFKMHGFARTLDDVLVRLKEEGI